MTVDAKTKDLYAERISGRPGTVVDDAVRFAKDYATGFVERKKRELKNYLRGLVGLGYDDPLTRDRASYQAFKDVVKRALEGDDLGLDIYEVPFESLARENALGVWKGKKIRIPKLRDIPEMLGSGYKRFSERGYRGHALDGQVQDYILLHEKMEAITRPDNHDLYEATLLRALADLANEGDARAGEVYEGAMATYKVRMERGDSFARNVQKYYTWLEQDVQEMFGPEKTGEVSLN